MDTATQVLLEEAGPDGEFGQVVRDPLSGERALVVVVRGEAVDDVLGALRRRRPSLLSRIAGSFDVD